MHLGGVGDLNNGQYLVLSKPSATAIPYRSSLTNPLSFPAPRLSIDLQMQRSIVRIGNQAAA
jgi:hypothetical protein